MDLGDDAVADLVTDPKIDCAWKAERGFCLGLLFKPKKE
jgi:hypothetical protein